MVFHQMVFEISIYFFLFLQLKRIGGQVNVTVHDQSTESQMIHVKIAMSGAVISGKNFLSVAWNARLKY